MKQSINQYIPEYREYKLTQAKSLSINISGVSLTNDTILICGHFRTHAQLRKSKWQCRLSYRSRRIIQFIINYCSTNVITLYISLIVHVCQYSWRRSLLDAWNGILSGEYMRSYLINFQMKNQSMHNFMDSTLLHSRYTCTTNICA